MTIKTRSLPRFLGEVDDTLYSASTSQTYDSLWPSYNDESAWIAQYYTGQSNRGSFINVPATYGTELLNTTSGKGRQNPCYHTKLGIRNLPFLIFFGKYNYSSTRNLYKYWRLPYPTVIYPSLTKPAWDVSAAKRRAYHHMRPRFDGDISMINFLFELKDFRDIAKALPKLFSRAYQDFASIDTRWWWASVEHLHSDVVKWLRGVASEPTLPIARAWLIHQFAISPLMKDISSMVGQATISAMDAQSKFKTLGLEEQTSHYSEKKVFTETGTAGSYNSYWTANGEFSSTKYTATCKYLYDYTLRDHTAAFMRYWGLGGSFEALWNMAPWSFLADYVIQIGKSLHAMERDPNVTNWNIKSWTDSEKYTISKGYYVRDDLRTKVLVINGKYMTPTQAHGTLLSGVEGSIYERKVSQPTIGLYVPKLKGPSLKQWLNVVALARCFF